MTSTGRTALEVGENGHERIPPDPAMTYGIGSLGLQAANLLVPRPHPGQVRRTRLLRRLRTERDHRIVSIVAPAGYGKTTLLVQLATSAMGSVAWLTADDGDHDPGAFLGHLTAALDLGRRGTPDIALTAHAGGPQVSPRALVGRLLAALYAHPDPTTFVIDDVHRISGDATFDVLAELIGHLPVPCRVVVAGREPAALPLARWRADGSLLELGPDSLAMDEEETGALLRRHGLTVTAEATRRLISQTEGWPAMLALAALQAARSDGRATPEVSVRDLAIADYLRAELLEIRPSDEIAFLTRTSILERLDGGLCDAVMDSQGSTEVLAGLARSTLLVDEYGGTHRYHPLLREFLHDELRIREPGLETELHRRAAVWLEANGAIDQAVEHAFATSDVGWTAALIGRAMVPYHWSGRRATVRAWLRRFGEEALGQQPWLAVLAAWEEVGVGETVAAEHFADIAERGRFDGTPPDGTASFTSGRAILRAAMVRRGVEDMLANAQEAVALEAPASRWRDMALWTLALARLATGDPRGCDDALADAVAVARANGNGGLACCLIGHRALLAIERLDWRTAATLAAEGEAIAGSALVEGYPTSAFVFAARARLAMHRGDVNGAREALTRAAVLRPMLSAAAPVFALVALVALARAHLAIGDTPGARALLAQARHIVRLRPHLGVLEGEVVELQDSIGRLPPSLAWGASSLTATELRVLALLPFYLSFKEIGQRLGIKATTVKTHAVSIYGKLGASTRSEAVELAVEAGLLDRLPA